MFYLTTLPVSQPTERRMNRSLEDSELNMIWKEAAVAWFEVGLLSW
jgi:hypothetical protein